MPAGSRIAEHYRAELEKMLSCTEQFPGFISLFTFFLYKIWNQVFFAGVWVVPIPVIKGIYHGHLRLSALFRSIFFIFYASGRIFWSLINWYKTRQQFFDANTSIPIGWRKIKLEIRLSKEIMDIVNALFYTSLLKEKKTLHYCHYSILWFLVQVKSS